MRRLLSQTAQAIIVLLVVPALVGAEVTRVEITSRRDAAGGQSFGSTARTSGSPGRSISRSIPPTGGTR